MQTQNNSFLPVFSVKCHFGFQAMESERTALMHLRITAN